MATNNFSKVLGQGGFGPVYKGNLPTGEDVAIKILSNASQQGAQEFLNEVFDFFSFICVYFVLSNSNKMFLACYAFRILFFFKP